MGRKKKVQTEQSHADRDAENLKRIADEVYPEEKTGTVATEKPIQQYVSVACPGCKASNGKIQTYATRLLPTNQRQRYHRCKNCGRCFQTMEKIE